MRFARVFLTDGSLAPADILWSPKVLRISECGYPFATRFPALSAWFQEGVMARNRLMSGAFKLKAALENVFGKRLGAGQPGAACVRRLTGV